MLFFSSSIFKCNRPPEIKHQYHTSRSQVTRLTGTDIYMTWMSGDSACERTTNLHRTVILESQLLHRPVGLTVINCFKGMREQMALIHWATYPPSSVQKYSAMPLDSQSLLPSLLYGVWLQDFPGNIFKS